MAEPRRGTTLFTALLIVVGTAVVMQLWLLTAAMDALLAQEYGLLLPLTLGSFLLFALNAALLKFVFDFDRRVEQR
jgi:hypothetical protein